MSKIYYLRRNHRAGHPKSILFLDCETRGVSHNGDELHRMYMAWTWRITLGNQADIRSEEWKHWNDSTALCDYIATLPRQRNPLHIIGSNITFDLFATGLMAHLHETGWECEVMYEKGTTTIFVVVKDGARIRFLALQNWMPGGVKQWGKLLGIEKMEVDFTEDEQTIKDYCRRDVEITGRTFLSYLDFVRTHNMGRFRWTAPGQALACYRHRFLPERTVLHYDQRDFNKFVRAGYCGGRVECRQIGRVKGNKFVQLDVNSMYPTVMRQGQYPGKLLHWVANCSLDRVRKALAHYCAMASVAINTDQPAYAKRHEGKLIFPVGEFNTYLCTGSLKYALEHGHITKVHHLATFTKYDLFSGWVDYFYPLKKEYGREQNLVWQSCVKLFLNALYGKFGELRDLELEKHSCRRDEVWRKHALVPVDTLQDFVSAFDQIPELAYSEDRTHLNATEWSVLGTYCMSVRGVEGPMSAPAIAAHVTDYARMLLWKYIDLVGWRDVLYCDTDSLIIEEKHLSKLEDYIDDETLGHLKVEGQATSLHLRGAKDYSFGGKLRRKGIRADSKKVGDNSFSQARFPGMYSLIRGGCLDSFPIGTITKTLTGNYTKGVVRESGVVDPIESPD